MRTGTRIVLSLVLSLAGGHGVAQAVAPRTVQLAVSVRNLAGDPVTGLAHRFQIASAGVPLLLPLPYKVLDGTAPQMETHLLCLGGTVTPGSLAKLSSLLKPLWKAGWQIQLRQSNGAATGYVRSAAQLAASQPASANRFMTVPDAVSELLRFQGRKLVFVLDSPTSKSRTTIRASLRQEGTEVYAVGGDIWRQQVAAGSVQPLPQFNGNPANASVGYNLIASAPQYMRVRGGVTEETTLHAAVQDALVDGTGFYLLTVAVPPGCEDLSLHILTGTSSGPYRVTAQASEEGRTPPRIVVITR